jgi:phosphoenolpyruvate-protein phosphotransferase (PTS system enzyme I)
MVLENKMRASEEIRLKGLSLSPGIVWGKVVYLSRRKKIKKKNFLRKNEVDKEIFRYRLALLRSKKDLQQLQKSCSKQSSSLREILQSHLELLSDPTLVQKIEDNIRHSQLETETAFESLMEEYQQRFHKMENSFLQERMQDIRDVSQRVLRHLHPPMPKKKQIENGILLAEEIFPSDSMGAEGLAFVSHRGGYNSHAAIIARSRGIPYVSEIDLSKIFSLKIEKILVDATAAEVVLNPSEKTLRFYQKKIQILQEEKTKKQSLSFPSENLQGRKIECYLNIETVWDVDRILKHQMDGVGIFRTEFLFHSERTVPSMERQKQIYSEMAKKIFPLPLVIRLFDLGADKSDLFLQRESFLEELQKGSRGIRFLLHHPQILDDQLQAICEASKMGNVRLLIPFVSEVEEILFVKKRLRELQKNLFGSSPPHLPMGCMVEIPSAALMAQHLAQEVDFLSIGTNDLVHYLLAQDRSRTSSFPKRIPSSLVKVLQMVIQAAQIEKKPVVLCGEMASHTDYLPIFLGIGIEKFSLSIAHLASFKEALFSLSHEKIEEKTKEALFFL